MNLFLESWFDYSKIGFWKEVFVIQNNNSLNTTKLSPNMGKEKQMTNGKVDLLNGLMLLEGLV